MSGDIMGIEPRTPKEIIDQAIKENSLSSKLLYLFATAFVVVGLSVLVWSVYKGQALSAILGALSSSLFWPALRLARRTRKENIAIRLLEAPLERADTAREATEMLQKLVNEILSNRKLR
ncbi:MAG: hypothetical protein JSV32_04460 [Dehalococcoidia bacterium]|nr:MAG: hypothetical protein JSV32_04460 [Dehalococcoidia bacterium]